MNQAGIAVAVIEPVGGHGGMDPFDRGLCRGLLAAGCRVSWYTCAETVDPNMPGLNFRPYYKGIFGKANRWLRAVRYVTGSLCVFAKAVVSGEKICHLHFFHGSGEELMLMTMAKLCGRKVVLTVHDVESLAGGGDPARIGAVYGRASLLIVHNQVSKAELVDKFGVSKDKIRVLPLGNCLETNLPVPAALEAKRQLGIREQGKVVLFFGQIKDVKGLDVLIRAIPQVLQQFPDMTLVIAGRPWKTDFSQYDAMIDAVGIREQCTLHLRFIPDALIAHYYASADVVVLPYRRIYQSGVLLQAMGYARPVLVSDLPGMTEMITEGENGYVFEEGSHEALSAALLRVLQNDRERNLIADRGLQYVIERHDWTEIGMATKDLYESVLKS